jgi:hypothetical protein
MNEAGRSHKRPAFILQSTICLLTIIVRRQFCQLDLHFTRIESF